MESGSPGDLRPWLRRVDALGELRLVRGAHWELEIGDISQLNYESSQPHAMLFDDLMDYATGLRVITGTMSTPRRLGLTLRVGTDETDASLVTRLRGATNRWASEAASYPARVVQTGPVLTHAIAAKDVNFLAFPAPLWHEFDGGRFIGTGCMVVTSDPESGVVNGGAYRIQVHGAGETATVAIVPGKHGAQNVEAWFEREGRAPVTVSFGHDPLLLLVAGTEVPLGMSELDYAGAIAGESVDVVMASNGLPIPAASELAVEGWFRPENTAPEGPFGEWTGYYSESEGEAYVLEVTRLFHRPDPILLGTPPGMPPHDYSYMRSVMKSAMVLDALHNSGVPGIKDVWAHGAGGGRILLVVSMDQRYAGHSRQVGYLTSQLPAGAYMNRYVVTVDSDIDVRSLHDVMWAMCTRTDPAIDIEILRRTWGSTADPLLPPGTPAFMSRAVIDACVPFDRKGAFPTVARSDPARLQATREKWGHLFGSAGAAAS